MHLVDIWNVIEAFRENGLNTLEPTNEVSVARLETLISSLYHNLNKRLPTNQQVPVDSKAGLLLNWLLSAYTNDNSGIRVFSIKVALAIMCAGKLVDKLRCKSVCFCLCSLHCVDGQKHDVTWVKGVGTFCRDHQRHSNISSLNDTLTQQLTKFSSLFHPRQTFSHKYPTAPVS